MLKTNETIALHGKFYLRVYRKCVLVEEWGDPNMIVNAARHLMARLISEGAENLFINRIAFGTNGSIPEASDTLITNQFVKSLSGHSFPKTGDVQFDWLLKDTENNGMAISEFGLLTADGTLFARKVRTYPINKESDISLEGHWIISFKE
jgi:hypothetical protein